MKANVREHIRELAAEKGQRFWKIHAAYRIYYSRVNAVAQRFAKGEILEVGSGTGIYRRLFEKFGHYRGMDLHENDGQADLIGDFMAIPIADATIDTLCSFQVLQYVPDPRRAFAEARRVLKPGGVFILGVPHLSYLNNEPFDRWRFTDSGIRELAREAGFEVVEVHRAGGWFAFHGWILATFLFGVTGHTKWLRKIVWNLNAFLQVAILALDRVIPTSLILPVNYLVVMQVPKE